MKLMENVISVILVPPHPRLCLDLGFLVFLGFFRYQETPSLLICCGYE